jgi:hypothetical protein
VQVRIRFFFATEDRVFDNVGNVVQKGDLISIWIPETQTAHKFPIYHIMEIQEIHKNTEEINEVALKVFPPNWVQFNGEAGLYGGRTLD